jgi:hypothetical protein
MVPRAGVEPAPPFGERILSPVIGPLPDLTKRYKPVFYAPSGRQGIASAGLVSTRPATILAPSYSNNATDQGNLKIELL